jgi:enoyl-CoA hydratase/carnithine racemase
VTDEPVTDAAVAYAHILAAKPREAMQQLRRLLREGQDLTFPDFLAREWDAQRSAFTTPDAGARIRAVAAQLGFPR